MSTEQELLIQIEELRKKEKHIEEQNKDSAFNKQRNFLINTIRDFLGIEVSDAEALSVLYKHSPSHTSQNPHGEIGYYLKKEDENMLFERKVKNRYAKYHEVRCEDSDMIISNFLGKIKPHINHNEFQQEQQKKYHQHREKEQFSNNYKEYVAEKYVPLFC